MKTKWVSAPYLVWMTVFIAVPLLMIAVFAFTTYDGEFTVKNIQDVGQYANIFFRSIWLSVIATAICLVVYPFTNGKAQAGDHAYDSNAPHVDELPA